MAAVKGSKQHKMIVVTHRPALLWGVAAAGAGAILLCLFIGFQLGRSSSPPLDPSVDLPLDVGDVSLARAKEIARNPDAIVALMRDRSALQQKVVALEQSAALDKEALAGVQATLAEQRDTVAQLQEDLLFYRQIATPENAEAERGLVIGGVSLSATAAAPRRVRYKFEFRQVGDSERLDGHANISIMGDLDGERVSLPLHTLALSDLEADIPLGFRYFQNVEGELELPEGFEPVRIQVSAVVEGEGVKEKSLGWVVNN